MSSMYEQAYNQYLKMEGSSFVSPEKPKPLGGRPDVKVAEAQIAKIGATNIAIYERFSAIRKENKRLGVCIRINKKRRQKGAIR